MLCSSSNVIFCFVHISLNHSLSFFVKCQNTMTVRSESSQLISSNNTIPLDLGSRIFQSCLGCHLCNCLSIVC